MKIQPVSLKESYPEVVELLKLAEQLPEDYRSRIECIASYILPKTTEPRIRIRLEPDEES